MTCSTEKKKPCWQWWKQIIMSWGTGFYKVQKCSGEKNIKAERDWKDTRVVSRRGVPN